MQLIRLTALAALAGLTACGASSKSETAPARAAAAAPTAAATPAGRPSNDLIPRSVFFGNPDRAGVQISPDGKMLSWLAAEGGVLNVFVAPVGSLDQARAITADKTRPVRRYFWAHDNKHVIYVQDKGGDEDWHVYSVDVASGKAIDLTPFDKINAQVSGVSHRKPGRILVGINNRVAELHDVYEVDIATGERKLVVENPGYLGFAFDDDLALRTATQMTPDGGMKVLKPGKPKDGKATFTDFYAVGPEDMMLTSGFGFDKRGGTMFMIDSRGRDTAAFVAMDMKTKKTRVLAEDARADGSNIMMHPTENTVQAVSFTREREAWKVLDKKVAPDFEKLTALARDGEFAVTSRTLDDKTWVVATTSDRGPVRYHLWDRKAQKETFLFSNRKALEGLELAAMKPVTIRSRDGLELVSYLSLPVASDADGDGKPDAALPMVLYVHGGPWARDEWGYNPAHQLLANRGYAVLSVNYRGSTGFGKQFVNAGDRQWAGTMHDDLIDAVKWAFDSGVADPARTCIMGGSYGGFATLVGLTFTPDTFACGVDIVGPSNLVTFINTIPPYWKPMMDLLKLRVGDVSTPEGRKELEARSPLFKVDAIKKPLLIAQGANDPRIKQSESDQIVKAMREKNIPVTYVLFPDEGHGFARPENNTAFFAIAEAFLSAHIGGQFQPLEPSVFAGSTTTVPVGVEGVPGLSAALKK